MTTRPSHHPGYDDDLSRPGSTTADPVNDTDDRSIGDIIGDVANDLGALMHQELDLARTELKQEATRAGKGAAMLGAAGVGGHLALLFASFALMFLLDDWMPIELAAVIVALVWALVTAALGLRGKQTLQQTNPELPTTQRTLKEDVRWAKAQKN